MAEVQKNSNGRPNPYNDDFENIGEGRVDEKITIKPLNEQYPSISVASEIIIPGSTS